VKTFQKCNVREQGCWPNRKLKEIVGEKQVGKLKANYTMNLFIHLSITYAAQSLKISQGGFCSIK
jgi:hypothetical protein